MADARSSITEIYIAAFNRVPDTAGLAFWVDAYNRGQSLSSISQSFTTSTEYQAKYPTFLTNSEYVDKIYTNVFGRAADASGKAFWVSTLDNKALTWGTIMQAMLDAAHANGSADGPRLTNQATFGVYCATNSVDPTKGTAYLSSITADAATVTAAENSLQSSNGQTFTLTTAADTFTGTTANDTFNAVHAAAGSTWTAGDVLDGAGGNDVLNLSAVNGVNGFAATSVQVKNMKTLRISNVDSGNAITYAQSSLNKVTDVYDTSSVNNVTITGAASLGTYGLENSGAAHTFTVTVNDSVMTGTADSATLVLNNAGTKTAASTALINSSGTSGIETLNIQTTGAASVLADIKVENSTGGTGTATKMVVTGNQNLTVNNALNFKGTGGTLDASAFTGNLSVQLTTTQDDSIVGGTGNDTFNFTTGLTALDTVDGGAGTDVIRVSQAHTTALSNVKNVEVLQADGGASFSGTLFSGLNTVRLAGSNLSATVSNNSSAVTVEARANQSALTLTAAASGATANLTLDNSQKTTADAGIDVAALTLTNISTLNVKSSGGNLAANATQDLGLGTALNVKTLNITGDTAATVAVQGTVFNALDASAFTGALNFTSSASTTGAQTFTTGTGNDVLALTAAIAAATDSAKVTTGTGNDVVVLSATSAGTRSIDFGGGDDTLKITALANMTSADTVTGGDGTDMLQIATARGTTTADIKAASWAGLQNASGIEKVSIGALDNLALSLDDGTIAATGGSINISVDTNRAHSVDASGVTGSTSAVNVSVASGFNRAFGYTVANGIDSVTSGAGADTFTVSTNTFLKSTDKLAGGTGNDTITFTQNATGNITADQLSALSGIETVSINNATGVYTVAINDTIVGANATSTGGFTVARTSSNTGTLTVDGSGIGSGYALTFTGGAGKDSLYGGAGNDVITGNAGADSLTGGAGNDTFKFAVSSDAAAGEVINGGDGTGDALQLTQDSNGIATSNSFVTSTLSNLEVLDIQRGATAIFAGSQLNGATYSVTDSAAGIDGVLQVTATAGSSTSLAGLTFAKNSSGTVLFGNGAAINGSTIDDIITGSSQGDTIVGGGGNDTITGGSGADYFKAANGITVTDFTTTSDVIRVSGTVNNIATDIALSGADATTFGAYVLTSGTAQIGDGSAKLTITTTGATAVAGDIAMDLTLTGIAAGAATVTGTANADVFTLGGLTANANTTVLGGAGADTFTVLGTQAGSALLTVDGGALGQGNTLVITGAVAGGNLVVDLSKTATTAITNDTVVKYYNMDNLDVSAITGNGATVTTSGNALGSYVIGSSLADTVTDGANADRLYLGAGNDVVVVASGANVATGEIINAGAGTDRLDYVATGADTLTLVSGISGFESIELNNGTAATANTSTGAIVIDASAMSSGTFGLYRALGAATASSVTFTGTSGADTVVLGNANSAAAASTYTLTLGSGADTVQFSATLLNNGNINTQDNTVRITDFTSGTDRFDVGNTEFDAITGTGGILSGAAYTAATTGTSAGTLAIDIASALAAGGGTMVANGAALVTITGTSLAGNNITYLIVNDGTAAFAANADAVIALTGISSTTLTANDFV